MVNKNKGKVTPKSGSDANLGASTGPTVEWRKRRDEAIRNYHELGLCPIPLRGKAPYQKNWTDPAKYQGERRGSPVDV